MRPNKQFLFTLSCIGCHSDKSDRDETRAGESVVKKTRKARRSCQDSEVENNKYWEGSTKKLIRVSEQSMGLLRHTYWTGCVWDKAEEENTKCHWKKPESRCKKTIDQNCESQPNVLLKYNKEDPRISKRISKVENKTGERQYLEWH